MSSAVKIKIRYGICLLLMFAFTANMCGCTAVTKKRYSNYVKSLIGINYIGANDDYIKATGASKEEADALYASNTDMLATQIENYYGVTIADAPEMHEEYVDLAEHIYSKVNYSISKVYKGTSGYYVDVQIYPMDIFNQTSASVSDYIDTFNTQVENGTYNQYTLAEYETIFSRGLIDILYEASLEMTYAYPVTVTVAIIEDGDSYKIADDDFVAIDNAMFNMNATQ